MVQYLQPPSPCAGNKPGQSSRLCSSSATLAARLNCCSLRRGRTAAASVFTLWETPSARPRGFLLEQRATSVWDKTFNRHRYRRDNKQLIHTKPGCFRISTHTFVGFWKHRFSFFQFTYKTQLWLCRFGYLQIDSSVKFITCISHCEEEPSCLSLSSIKMTSDVLPRILNGFWHLNNTNKHVVWSPLKRFFAFQPRSCLYCRYSSSKATVMHTQWFCSRRRPEIWQKLLT